MRFLLFGLALSLFAGQALAQPPPEFAPCKVCHTAKSTPAGPHINGVFGRPIGNLADFRYSPALKAKGAGGAVWTETALDAYLARPTVFAPGTRMPVGAPDPGRRKAVIAYLKTLK